MNSVILIGNLTRDPELRYSTGANQTAICKFSIAVNDGFGENKRTSFVPVTVFGKAAESCDKYLEKGRKVAISGRLQTGSYEKDGRKVYTTDVIASSVEFLDNTNNSHGEQEKDAQNANQGFAEASGGGFSALNDDDIPF